MPAFWDLITDLIWPAVVLLAGWLVNRALQQRTEMQQTLQLMLPKIHENAEKYYMPLCTKILRLEMDWKKLETDLKQKKLSKESAETSDFVVVLFCDIWILLNLDQRITDEIGGWYLKDRKGEDLVYECWEPFRIELEDRFHRERKERMVRAIEDAKHYDQLLERFEGMSTGKQKKGEEAQQKKDWQEIREAFLEWVKTDFDEHLNLLVLMKNILRYEMNRPYEIWYGCREELAAEFTSACTRLENWGKMLESSNPEKAKTLGALHGELIRQYAAAVRGA